MNSVVLTYAGLGIPVGRSAENTWTVTVMTATRGNGGFLRDSSRFGNVVCLRVLIHPGLRADDQHGPRSRLVTASSSEHAGCLGEVDRLPDPDRLGYLDYEGQGAVADPSLRDDGQQKGSTRFRRMPGWTRVRK